MTLRFYTVQLLTLCDMTGVPVGNSNPSCADAIHTNKSVQEKKHLILTYFNVYFSLQTQYKKP